jgi:histone deacetylase 6
MMPMDMDYNESSASSSLAQSSAAGKRIASSNHPSFVANGAQRAMQKSGVLLAFDESSANPSPARRSPAESTPEITNAMGERLTLDSVSDDDGDEDSIMDDASEPIYYDEMPPYGLPVSTLPTGLCYDARMRFHAEVAINESSYHPEDPRRIYYIFKELCEAGLVDDYKSRRPLVRQPLLRIDAREATEEECCLIHTRKHYEFVKSTSGEYRTPLIRRSSKAYGYRNG